MLVFVCVCDWWYERQWWAVYSWPRVFI